MLSRRWRLVSAIHVADKWHVFERYQRALSQVVNQKIDQLRKSGESAKARTLWDLKPAIMAVDPKKQKWRRYPKKPQRTFDFADDLKPVLDHPDNDAVSRAFWGRLDFLRFYTSRTLADAMPHLDRCRDRLAPLADIEKVKTFWNHLNSNWLLIANYFKTVQLRPSGKWRGATTNAIEQRNREIRKLADVRNGVQNFGLLRLLALYHKWHIGDEIVFCSERDCPAVWGPVFGPPVPPEIRQASGIHPRCPDHL
ncbi:transposase [Sphingomonas sp. CCH5-D11]|uniref:transposase n=1 Tax=Sphingomonas sp. CCH5-D11 TaxID=1768786 RepID=UPI000834B3F5|nr:transposase [Sphingomonas sp. CCH5-D11]